MHEQKVKIRYFSTTVRGGGWIPSKITVVSGLGCSVAPILSFSTYFYDHFQNFSSILKLNLLSPLQDTFKWEFFSMGQYGQFSLEFSSLLALHQLLFLSCHISVMKYLQVSINCKIMGSYIWQKHIGSSHTIQYFDFKGFLCFLVCFACGVESLLTIMS